jgi:Ca2+-binding EF-hand superfamily protein
MMGMRRISMRRTFAALSVALGFGANDMISSIEFGEVWADFNLFENFDDDDNNTVSRMEYNEAVNTIYETDAYFRGLDRDRSGTLTRDEFVNGWFTMFDSDRSGSQNRTEFRSAMDALTFEL